MHFAIRSMHRGTPVMDRELQLIIYTAACVLALFLTKQSVHSLVPIPIYTYSYIPTHSSIFIALITFYSLFVLFFLIDLVSRTTNVLNHVFSLTSITLHFSPFCLFCPIFLLPPCSCTCHLRDLLDISWYWLWWGYHRGSVMSICNRLVGSLVRCSFFSFVSPYGLQSNVTCIGIIGRHICIPPIVLQ